MITLALGLALSTAQSVIIDINDPSNVSGIDTAGLPNPSLRTRCAEILDAVAKFNDSTVSSYSLDAELVTGELKDLNDITVEQFLGAHK